MFVAPSTSGGTCYAIRLGAMTTGPNCQTPPTATELQLGVGWSKNSAEIVGRVGSNVSRVLVRLQNGKTRTITPIQGYIFTALPPSANASHSPVRTITAITANGKVIEQPGSSLSGGSGTITRLSAASITIGTRPATHTCRVTDPVPFPQRLHRRTARAVPLPTRHTQPDRPSNPSQISNLGNQNSPGGGADHDPHREPNRPPKHPRPSRNPCRHHVVRPDRTPPQQPTATASQNPSKSSAPTDDSPDSTASTHRGTSRALPERVRRSIWGGRL